MSYIQIQINFYEALIKKPNIILKRKLKLKRLFNQKKENTWKTSQRKQPSSPQKWKRKKITNTWKYQNETSFCLLGLTMTRIISLLEATKLNFELASK